uniref:Uncharacterized protein n=1 Tax=Nelumbo nucifera TaxID=4432 RepID=A0A822Y5D7_NELNU|nr:TPA_asm: hypothetical protein HUJ06_028279 [Nelumbo nucifera]
MKRSKKLSGGDQEILFQCSRDPGISIF